MLRRLLLLLLLPAALPAGAAELRLGGSEWIADAPTRIADQLGWFSETSMQQFPSGRDALTALLAGELEFALAAPTPVAAALLNTQSQEQMPIILASVAMSGQSHYIVTFNESGIETPADFSGKRLGLVQNSSAHYSWQRFADRNGLAEDDVELHDIRVDQHLQALLEQRVDAVVTWDPSGAALQQSLGPERIRIFPTRQLHTVNWLLITRNDVLQQHEAAITNLLATYANAISLIHNDPERARALQYQAGSAEPQELARLETGVIWRLALDWSVLTNLHEQLQWQRARLRPDRDILPAPGDYIRAAPLRRIAPDAVTIPDYLLAYDTPGVPAR